MGDDLEFDETELFGGSEGGDAPASSASSASNDEDERGQGDQASATEEGGVKDGDDTAVGIASREGNPLASSLGISPSASSQPISVSPSNTSWRPSADFRRQEDSGSRLGMDSQLHGRVSMTLPNAPTQLGCSLPMQVPVWTRREQEDADDEDGPPVKRVVMASTFIPPHQLSFNSSCDFLANLEAGTSPAALLKKDKLRARNAILRSTGFLEQGSQAAPLPGVPARPSALAGALAGGAPGPSSGAAAAAPPSGAGVAPGTAVAMPGNPPTIMGGFPPSRSSSFGIDSSDSGTGNNLLPIGGPSETGTGPLPTLHEGRGFTDN